MEELVPFTPEVIPERINPDWTTPLYAISLFKSVCIDAKNDPSAKMIHRQKYIFFAS